MGEAWLEPAEEATEFRSRGNRSCTIDTRKPNLNEKTINERIAILLALLLMNYISMVSAEESAFDTFLTRFDYETRADMKIYSKELVALLRSR